MASKYTTHQLAKMLEEVGNALRELPDTPLSDFQPPRVTTSKTDSKITEAAESLPKLSKDEAIKQLTDYSQKQLVQLCRHLKINIGSNKTKPNLIDQLVWHYYGAADELERIRNYDESRQQAIDKQIAT